MTIFISKPLALAFQDVLRTRAGHEGVHKSFIAQKGASAYLMGMKKDSPPVPVDLSAPILLGERDDTCIEAVGIDELVARAAALGFSRGELERLAEVYGLEFAKNMVHQKRG